MNGVRIVSPQCIRNEIQGILDISGDIPFHIEESFHNNYIMWCDYYPDTKQRILRYNPKHDITLGSIYHELGHIFNSNSLYSNIWENYPESMNTLRINSEYNAQTWALGKALANKDWNTFDELYSWVDNYQYYNKNCPIEGHYYWAFRRIKKKLYKIF